MTTRGTKRHGRKRFIRQLTTSNFDFPSLITDPERKYVDKTDLLYELARHKSDSQLFISRPRRFGKSLMLSTLQAMFEGRRDLFKGLKLDALPWECWNEKNRYPVYNFSMSDATGQTFDEVKEQLGVLVDCLFAQAGCPVPEKGTIPGKFKQFILAAAKKSPTKQIVVLIDEYDVPVQGFLDSPKELNRVRKLLHDFYEKLKTNSKYIRFLMMTGVTKLTKLSVFSGMNHLKDRSMDSRFATLFGYTTEELDGSLRENVDEFGFVAVRLGGADVAGVGPGTAVEVESGAARARHVVHVAGVFQQGADGDDAAVGAEADAHAGGVAQEAAFGVLHDVWRAGRAGEAPERRVRPGAQGKPLNRKRGESGVVPDDLAVVDARRREIGVDLGDVGIRGGCAHGRCFVVGAWPFPNGGLQPDDVDHAVGGPDSATPPAAAQTDVVTPVDPMRTHRAR
ncbi:MAG: AAA family ATPase [Kiritimatiellae bacterium]|nr:AAA family ATPase [Kiritimatiellia bacterium]